MLTKRVTSTAPHVHLVHEEGRPPVEGVAVYYYARSDATGRARNAARPRELLGQTANMSD